MTTHSTLVNAVLAIFSAEANVQAKRSDAAREYKTSADVARKDKGFNLGKWAREQSAAAKDALIDASGLRAEYEALDDKGRKEHAAEHGKEDSLSVLIRQIGSLTVRFSEMKRLYLLDREGDAYARKFFAGELRIGQALELLHSTYRNDKAEGAEGGEGGEGGETEAEASDASEADKFRAALTMWATKAAKEQWVAEFANIMAEVAQTVAAK